jgi:hypothetical protein
VAAQASTGQRIWQVREAVGGLVPTKPPAPGDALASRQLRIASAYRRMNGARGRASVGVCAKARSRAGASGGAALRREEKRGWDRRWVRAGRS